MGSNGATAGPSFVECVRSGSSAKLHAARAALRAPRVAPKSSLSRPARSGVSWRDKARARRARAWRAVVLHMLSLPVLSSLHNANYAIRANSGRWAAHRLPNAVCERLTRGVRKQVCLSANSSGAAEALRGCDFMPTTAATGSLRPTPSPPPSYKLDLLTNLLDREDDDRSYHYK